MHNHSSHNQISQDQKVTAGKLLMVTGLNLLISIVELAGGLLSHSLALFSDALHNIGDAFSTFIAWIAIHYGNKKSNLKSTFGLKRIEILAALFNAITMVILCFFLCKEAVERFLNPQPVDSKILLIVAIIGFLANIYAVYILRPDSGKSINVRAAYIHLIADSLSSFVVIAGGLLMLFFEIYWVDPLITFIICIYILKETYTILKQLVNILMQNTPECLDLKEIKDDLEKIPEIKNIHHVHAWNLTDTLMHFEAHVDVSEDLPLSRVNEIRLKIEDLLSHTYSIYHVTLQFEYRTDHNPDMIHKGL